MHKHRYVLYLESDLNRVFTGSLGRIAATELNVVVESLHPGALGPVTADDSQRSTTLHFGCDLEPERLGTLAGQLSSTLALFEEVGDLLRPIPTTEHLVYSTELVTTQRYKGKTNERFTRAMLTMALAVAGIDPTSDGTPNAGANTHPGEAGGEGEGHRPRICDPMCGRGTTLNWALAQGFDAVGIEPDRLALDQHANFISQWAKRQRLPHTMQDYRPTNSERRYATFTVAPDRAALKAGQGQVLDVFCADGADGSLPIKRRSIDVIVTDMPYGVHHASRTGPGRSGRWDPSDTAELAERMVPTWRRWLRPGGTLALAWNTKRADTNAMRRIVTDAGFELCDDKVGGTDCLRHKVDSSIDRDVILARA